jgi:AcrR family transcriptional regulator
MEHVARRAGCNKALLYRYFGDRENLFREALRVQFARRAELLDEAPRRFDELLPWWTGATLRDPTFVRMILRESLDFTGGEPVESEARTQYYARQQEVLEGYQKDGTVEPEYDPQLLFLALLAVVVAPAILPQVVRLVAGTRPEDPEFLDRWHAFLARLARSLAPTESGP